MSRREKQDAKKVLKRYSEHEFVQKNDREVFKKILKQI